ncbi:MAG: methyltransferase, CheR-type [Chloroflexi bacterium]|nr:methyltransferase, CheR-type [Chloroflexota bacterium]
MDSRQQERENLEIELLLEAIFRYYGFDFRDYAPASLRRRIIKARDQEGISTITGLTERLLHNPNYLDRFVQALSVNVTSMFRDPEFFLTFRKKVVPMLRTYPSIQIWNAGCSTGEEAYSLAILLEEEGLYARTRIYATDINEEVLKKAREGIFPLEDMKDYTANYMKAGGEKSFSEYYSANYGNAIMRPGLGKNITFAQHNLVTDGPFNQFQVICCRNVTIYFNKELKNRVHELLYQSLVNFGILGLGSKESIHFTPKQGRYEQVENTISLYRKIG